MTATANPTLGQEATVLHNLSTPAPIGPSEPGALGGHEIRCSCGFHATTSLSAREALRLGVEHRDWMRSTGR